VSRHNKERLQGHDLESMRETIYEVAHVRVHKLGSDVTTWFTPAEAREFAAALVRAADRAEK
jgi:hypothetical protein